MKLNKRIIIVMTMVCSLFLITVLYLTYFTLFQSKDIYNSSYNQRIWEKEQRVLRGKIYDRTGVLLAESEVTDEGQKRNYPFGKLYAHTIGYNSRTYGKTNIELKYNSYMLKTQTVLDVIKNEKDADKTFSRGANLELTFDNEMVKLASKLMGNDFGSIVAINPVTGEVYCMYSNPTFDPNEEKLVKNWDKLSQDAAAPFVARATQGRYAPGSTFKIITAAAAIESGNGDYTVVDKGKVTVGGYEFKNSGTKSYGKLDMKGAIKYSSNVYFSSLSQKIGRDNMESKADGFFITKKIPFDIDVKSKGQDFSSMDTALLASTSIGQGKLQVTPLNMALAACAIANKGVIMKPYMVNKVLFDNGKEIYSAKSEVLSTPIKTGTAEKIGEYMVECVRGGTGRSAAVSSITVAGKTGTAENEKKGKTHAWFICYAPAENPQIAVCVMKEYSGRGGASCAPLAAEIIKYALNSGLISK